MKTVKIGNSTITYLADKANTLYTMAANKAISSQSHGIDIVGEAKNRHFEVNGTIDSDIDAVRIGASNSVDFRIGKTGEIVSDSVGVLAHGAQHVIRNAGTIEGGVDGIRAYGLQTIVNSGEISGFNGLNLYVNGYDSATVRNTGSISGTQWSIYGSAENEKIVNSGDLHGDVQLGGGLDVFVHKGGQIDGVVRGGLGTDTYIVRAAGLDIVEGIDEGKDTVRASIDFELQSNVEVLYLTGKRDIDGTGNGNGSNNELYGNSGNNRLSAGYGFDILDGGKGNDVLEGGVGADQFQFTRGTGRDVVLDYEATHDDFYFVGLKGASTFEDMIENHAVEKGGNVVITFGTDVVVIKGHEIADLQQGDFNFSL